MHYKMMRSYALTTLASLLCFLVQYPSSVDGNVKHNQYDNDNNTHHNHGHRRLEGGLTETYDGDSPTHSPTKLPVTKCVVLLKKTLFQDNKELEEVDCYDPDANAYHRLETELEQKVMNDIKEGNAKSGATLMSMDDAGGSYETNGDGRRVLYASDVHSITYEDIVPQHEHGRRLAVSIGTKAMLAIRVIAADATTTASLADISDNWFGTSGDPVNLKSQYAACSYDALECNPASKITSTGVAVTNGVYQVTITNSVTGVDRAVVEEAVVAAGNSDLGNMQNLFDHVMLCLPPGTPGDWIGYAYVNHYLSVYNDDWCNNVSIQMHEIGHNLNLAHSGEDDVYDDKTCMMGYSYNLDDLPKMCFNAPKGRQLGWYLSGQHAVVDEFEGKILGISNYDDLVTGNGEIIMAILNDPINALDWYVSFNRATGINANVQEAPDRVLVHKRVQGTGYAESDLMAKLSAGESYNGITVNGYTVPVTVSSITTTGVGHAQVKIGNAPPTHSPTNAPTNAPTKAPVTSSPTKSPTHSPTKAPVTESPTAAPTSKSPTTTPTKNPTGSPTTKSPTMMPTSQPTGAPTKVPTKGPTSSPTTPAPTKSPTPGPTQPPTVAPTNQPTNPPTTGPPSKPPTPSPTNKPTTGGPSKPPTPNPTPAPTEDNITMYTGQYYVAWDVGNGRCVRDCDGPPPCGGEKKRWQTGYATESLCCSTMSTWKSYSECTYAPAPTPVPMAPGNPTRQPTNKPTSINDITMYTGQYYVDWSVGNGRCVRDCDGPRPCGGKKDPWQTGYATESVCCSTMSSWKPYSECTYAPAPAPTPAPVTPETPTRQPTNKPTAPQDTRWYNADSTCKNDGNGPSWSHKYDLRSTCCSSHFSWDYNNCMGIENNGTGAWYIDWGRGKCVQDCKTSQGGSCGGLVPGPWKVLHTSAEACCTAHIMSYASDDECIYNP